MLRFISVINLFSANTGECRSAGRAGAARDARKMFQTCLLRCNVVPSRLDTPCSDGGLRDAQAALAEPELPAWKESLIRVFEMLITAECGARSVCRFWLVCSGATENVPGACSNVLVVFDCVNSLNSAFWLIWCFVAF